MAFLFSHKIEVRFRDCDPLGHVNNAAYLTYLEQARLFYWKSLWGFGVDQALHSPGVILARAEIDYRLPAHYGQTLEVRIDLAAVGKTSFTYDYEVVDEGARVVASARTVQVMYDYGTGRPVPIPAEIRAKMQNT
ncbi:MAG TPA: thioesterase family protein [Vicinamibacterales bacterium]|nr:thioesterase family protein [Vicinamibacterales bacterium]